MTSGVQVVVAPNFHLSGEAADRVSGAAGGVGSNRALLFALPGHLRAAFWMMLEQRHTGGDFAAFSAEVGRFLAFKQLPPPEHAVCELVLHGTGGQIEPGGLWAVVNLGDDPAVVRLAGVQVRLEMGEGCQLPEAVAAEVVPPEAADPAVLLLVRRPRQPA